MPYERNPNHRFPCVLPVSTAVTDGSEKVNVAVIGFGFRSSELDQVSEVPIVKSAAVTLSPTLFKLNVTGVV